MTRLSLYLLIISCGSTALSLSAQSIIKTRISIQYFGLGYKYVFKDHHGVEINRDSEAAYNDYYIEDPDPSTYRYWQ